MDVSKIKLLDDSVYMICDRTARNGLINKQDKLISGSNIKTINGVSLVGSGDITVGGGGAAYTNGYGIQINSGEISVDTDVIAEKTYVDTKYTNGTGLNLLNGQFSVDTDTIATKLYVDTLIGDLSALLDQLNGEVI